MLILRSYRHVAPIAHPLLVGHDHRIHLIALLNSVHDILPLQDPTEYRMLSIQPGSRHMGNEALGAVRVGSGVGHRQDAGNVMLQIGMKLVLELVPWSSRPISFRASSLNHEVLDDSMKIQAVIEAV